MLAAIKQNTLVDHFSAVLPHICESLNGGCFIFGFSVEHIFEFYFLLNHLRGFKYLKHRIISEDAAPGSVEAAKRAPKE